MTLKGGDKKADQLGIWGPKEQRGDEFSGFSLCLMYSRLGAEKLQKTPVGADLKPQQKPDLSCQRSRKR